MTPERHTDDLELNPMQPPTLGNGRQSLNPMPQSLPDLMGQTIQSDKGFTHSADPITDPIVSQKAELSRVIDSMSSPQANPMSVFSDATLRNPNKELVEEHLAQQEAYNAAVDRPLSTPMPIEQDDFTNSLLLNMSSNEAPASLNEVSQKDSLLESDSQSMRLPETSINEGIQLAPDVELEPQDSQNLPNNFLGGEISKAEQKVRDKQQAEDLNYVMDTLNLSVKDWDQMSDEYFQSHPDKTAESTDSRDIMDWALEEITKDMSEYQRKEFNERLITNDPRLSKPQKVFKVWMSRTPDNIKEKGYIATPIEGLYRKTDKVNPNNGYAMSIQESKQMAERMTTYNTLFAGFDNIGEILDRKSSTELLGEMVTPNSELRTRLRNEIQTIFVESIGDNFYKRGANFTSEEKKMMEKFIVNLESNNPMKIIELKNMYEQTQQLFTRKMSMALKSQGYYTTDMPTEEEFNNWTLRVHSNENTGVPEFSVRLRWVDPESGEGIEGSSNISDFRQALEDAPDKEQRRKLLDYVVPSKHAD